MDQENPYAPPVDAGDPMPKIGESSAGLRLSAEGWATVRSLIKWMRIVSTFYYVLAVMAGVGLLAALATAASRSAGLATALALGLVLVVVLLGLGATWLRQAAQHFHDGVLADSESPLGLGFRKLRLYFILHGVFSLLSLARDVVNMT